jgi:hypothetical protein
MPGREAKPNGGRFAAVLAETLEAVASPGVRARIMDRAMAVHGARSVPETGPEVREFVEKALRAAIVSCLGEASASQVVESLEPIVQMVENEEAISEVRPVTPVERERSERPTAPAPDGMGPFDVRVPTLPRTPVIEAMSTAPPPPLELVDDVPDLPTDRPHSEAPEIPDVIELAMEPGPLGPVVIATVDGHAADELCRALPSSALAEVVQDGLSIFERLTSGAAVAVLLIDCRDGAIDIATAAALAADLDPPPLIVLWGATEANVDEVALASDHLRCLTLDASLDAAAVAHRL